MLRPTPVQAGVLSLDLRTHEHTWREEMFYALHSRPSVPFLVFVIEDKLAVSPTNYSLRMITHPFHDKR